MNVLSTFDGKSCGQIALKRAGIHYDNYFASEVDASAISITMKHFPNTVQLGDITKVHFRDGFLIANGKARYVGKIDLFMGGSPCQSFSNAGNGKGFDGKSGLFWEYVRLLNEVRPHNPDVKFLLENVKMKEAWKDIISEAMGVQPILINSNLVSAQNRQRLYWTNIQGVKPPQDKGILLADILEENANPAFHVSPKRREWIMKNNWERIRKRLIQVDNGTSQKAICLLASDDKNWNGNYVVVDVKGNIKRNQQKSACLTAGAHSGGNHSDMDILVEEGDVIRRLTPLEWERLQTLPDNYTEGVSNSQRYKMIGNGWTVDVIAHILNHLD